MASAGLGGTGPLPETPRSGEWNPARRAWIRRTLVRAALGALGTIGALGFVFWLGTRGVYNLPYVLSIIPSLLSGFYLTLEILGVVVPLGFALGFLLGWARTSRSAVLRAIAGLYVDFFRSMPPIVLIAFAFLIGLVAMRGTVANPFLVHSIALWLGVTALALHTAAYQAEIVRAGIQSVPAGQTEAADALGLTRARTMFRVVLPQAFRVSLPALGNEFSSVIKDSSLLSTIGWLELSGIGLVQVYAGLLVSPVAPILVWLEIGVLYFVVTYALNTLVRGVENTFKVPGLEAAHL
ncbi:MAG TPA: amino acid ABC transporter permease [Thermoplasmata archaeon]|nr:amino acid ABC transporter permease [Thermoplasmata archaeon]